MKYNNFHEVKPEPNTPIYWLNSVMKEIPGYWRGELTFVEAKGTRSGYVAKYWRNANDIEVLSDFPNIPINKEQHAKSIPIGLEKRPRGRPRRS